MSSTTLVATPRTDTGSAAARRLRTEGRVPGVVYGRGMAPISVTVDRRDLRLALGGPGGANTLLSLEVGGSSYPVVVKELQRHPIKRNVSHIDFLQVDLAATLMVQVPVRLDGEAKAVVNDGGLVDAAVDTIEVSCTPGNMPAEIVIDISSMQPGDIIRLGDIALPKGVTATGAADMPVVTILQTSGGQSAPAAPAADGATTE